MDQWWKRVLVGVGDTPHPFLLWSRWSISVWKTDWVRCFFPLSIRFCLSHSASAKGMALSPCSQFLSPSLSSHEVLVLNHWRCGQTTASAVDVQISSQIRTCYSKKASGMDTSSIKLSITGSQMPSQRFAMVYQHDFVWKPHSIPWFLIIVPFKWLGQTYIINRLSVIILYHHVIMTFHSMPSFHFHTLSARPSWHHTEIRPVPLNYATPLRPEMAIRIMLLLSGAYMGLSYIQLYPQKYPVISANITKVMINWYTCDLGVSYLFRQTQIYVFCMSWGKRPSGGWVNVVANTPYPENSPFTMENGD